MPALAAEGGDARNLARLAKRLARADAAIEVLADGAERYLTLVGQPAGASAQGDGQFVGQAFNARVFAGLPDEIRLRLLMRMIDRFGTEGPVELGKAETLLATLDRSFAEMIDDGDAAPGKLKHVKLRQTLAGALVSVGKGEIRLAPAPARRSRQK
jgi:tRNA(Ile)-lysidine synthase